MVNGIKLSSIAFYAFVILIVIVCLFPLLWTLNNSLKSHNEIFRWPPTWWPHEPTFGNYYLTFTQRPFALNIRNSLIVAGGTTLFCLAIGSFCAYALARLQFPGKIFVLGAVLSVSMFPQISIVSPLFILLKNLGWLNTFQGLVFPYTAFAMPLTVWILTSFFREMPFELEEAAKVDGCTPVQAFLYIIFPLAAPGLVTAGLLVFIAAWNELLFALSFASAQEMTRTIPVALTLFSRRYEVPWGELSAATVVVTVPLVLLVLIFQRRIVAGLTAGAVKG